MNKSSMLNSQAFFSGKLWIVIIVSMIIALLWPIPVLEIYSVSNDSLIFHSNLSKTRGFELNYIHSWDKTPVWDIFQIDIRGKLILVEERYLWMGAGLDSNPWKNINFKDNKVSVEQNQKIEELQLAVGTVANHKLLIGSTEIALTSLVSPGAKVIIKTTILPWLIFYMKGSESIV